MQRKVKSEIIMPTMSRRVDTTNLDEVASAIGPGTKLVWLESPTNPRQMVSDIRVRYICLLILPILLFLFFLFLISSLGNAYTKKKTNNIVSMSKI